MLPVVLALLVALPITETWLLLRVGHAIGALPTVAVLLAEAALGAWLLRREGSRAWQALQATLVAGRLPAAELTDAALVLVGGLLLMLPGFLTDVVGLVFLVPSTRPLARRLVGWFAARQVGGRLDDLGLLEERMRGSSTTIEGEVVPEPSPAPGRHGDRGRPDAGEPPAISGTVL